MTHENISNLSIENSIEIIRNYMKQIELNLTTSDRNIIGIHTSS